VTDYRTVDYGTISETLRDLRRESVTIIPDTQREDLARMRWSR